MLRLLVLIHQQTNTTNTCWFVTRNEKNLTLVAQTKIKHTGLGPCERVHYAVSDTTPMASEHVVPMICRCDSGRETAGYPFRTREPKLAAPEGPPPGGCGEGRYPRTINQTTR